MLDILNHLSSNESHMSFFLFGPPGQGPGPLGGGWRRPAGHGPGPRVGSMGQGAWARAHGPWPKPQLPSMLRIMFHKIRFGGGGGNTRFHENQKVPQRYYESIPTSSASRSLLCQKKGKR